MLQEAPKYFNPPPSKIVVFYEQIQIPLYTNLEEATTSFGCETVFKKFEILTKQKILEYNADEGITFYIYDDNAMEAISDPKFATLLTMNRHLSCFIAYLCHTIFPGNAAARLAANQVKYFILTKSSKMGGQVAILDRQLSLQNTLSNAYKDIRSRGEYGHVFVDCTPNANPKIVVRSLLLNDFPVVYRNQ